MPALPAWATQKLGPLPVWGWVGLSAAGGIGYVLYQRRRAAAAGEAAGVGDGSGARSRFPAGDAGGGPGGSGNNPDPGQPWLPPPGGYYPAPAQPAPTEPAPTTQPAPQRVSSLAGPAWAQAALDNPLSPTAGASYAERREGLVPGQNSNDRLNQLLLQSEDPVAARAAAFRIGRQADSRALRERQTEAQAVRAGRAGAQTPGVASVTR